MKKKDNETKEYNSFNLYYMNINKVYEISMMINNVIVSSYEKETGSIVTRKKYKKSSLEENIDSQFLSSIKAISESGVTKEKSSSSKMIEKLDIKTTKSILLKRIKDKAKEVENLDNCKEGELILLKSVKLSILDKSNLRKMLLLKRDALKGIQVEGIEINNIISSMIKDYSYVLAGNLKNKEKEQQFVIKIPFEVEDEFENNYSVDDIVLGNVTIIGIYKNKNSIKEITTNTLNYFSDEELNEEIETELKYMHSSKQQNTIKKDIDGMGIVHYIDIIGIIQEINFNETSKKKKRFWNKIFSKIRRNKDEK